MVHVKDGEASNDAGRMAARPSADKTVRCDPPLAPGGQNTDGVAPGGDDTDANDLQVEEPGYGYGV